MGKTNSNGFSFEINLDGWKKRDMDAWNEANSTAGKGKEINALCAKAMVNWSLPSDPKAPESYDDLTIQQFVEISVGIREAINDFFRQAQKQDR